MRTSSPRHSTVRLLFGTVSVVITLVAFGSITASRAAGQGIQGGPKDGLGGQPEVNASGMADYVQRIDFGAGSDPSVIFEGNLACGVPANCGGRDSVRIRIVPSNYATSADWDRALNNGNGYIVAKVSNLEGVRYDRLNLDGYGVGYVWVGDSQGLGRTVALYGLKSGVPKRLLKFKGHTFCRNSTPQAPAVHINTPSKCTDTNSMPMGAASQASIEPFTALASYVVKRVARMLAQPSLDSGLWISCSSGCCEAQF